MLNRSLYRHLFPQLRPRDNVSPTPKELGGIGGYMDGGYSHISNPHIPAGYTYFAQFVAHDLTCGEFPRLDLASVYGAGPEASPQLFDQNRPGLLRVGRSFGAGYLPDLPRNERGRAIIADFRSERTIIISQIHSAFIQYHNYIYTSLLGSENWKNAFAETQRIVRWQYQWLVFSDLLIKIVGKTCLKRSVLLATPMEPQFIPLEFMFAVGQFGHAMVQPRYRLNQKLHKVVGTPVFSDSGGLNKLADLRGQPIEQRGIIEWDNFFPIGNPVNVQASGRINTKICRPLFQIPYIRTSKVHIGSLPYLTLSHGQEVGLPSGQDVAIALSIAPIPNEELWGELPYSNAPAPLWYYILREAEVQQQGKRLGEVGAKIYGDILTQALFSDPDSYVHVCGPQEKPDHSFDTHVGDFLKNCVESTKKKSTPQ